MYPLCDVTKYCLVNYLEEYIFPEGPLCTLASLCFDLQSHSKRKDKNFLIKKNLIYYFHAHI